MSELGTSNAQGKKYLKNKIKTTQLVTPLVNDSYLGAQIIRNNRRSVAMKFMIILP